MGNQGYSNEGTRQCAEMIWAGEIGNVTEVHAWTDRPDLAAGPDRDSRRRTRAPPTLDWDLWLGIADNASVHVRRREIPKIGGNFYQPFNWRGFYDFGCGALGDMACHILGAPNMALRLGAPTSVECIKKEGNSTFMFPKTSVIRFDFPARGNMPPVKIFWYDGLKEQPEDRGSAGRRVPGRSAAASAPAGRKASAAAVSGDARRPPAACTGSVFRW